MSAPRLDGNPREGREGEATHLEGDYGVGEQDAEEGDEEREVERGEDGERGRPLDKDAVRREQLEGQRQEVDLEGVRLGVRVRNPRRVDAEGRRRTPRRKTNSSRPTAALRLDAAQMSAATTKMDAAASTTLAIPPRPSLTPSRPRPQAGSTPTDACRIAACVAASVSEGDERSGKSVVKAGGLAWRSCRKKRLQVGKDGALRPG